MTRYFARRYLQNIFNVPLKTKGCKINAFVVTLTGATGVLQTLLK